MAAPMEMPPTTTGPAPSSSIAAIRSSVKVAIDRRDSAPGSERPWPRISSVFRRKPVPAGKASRVCPLSPQSPCWKKTGAPAPPASSR